MAQANIDYELSVIRSREDGEEVLDAILESIKKIEYKIPDTLVGIGVDKVNDICSLR